MSVKLIVAMCKNNGIGFNNKIPWRISEDMIYFSKKTSGDYVGVNETIKKNAVIMGRNTWDSLPKKYKPLPNRFNIVLTRNPQKFLTLDMDMDMDLDDYDADKKPTDYISSLDEAIKICYGGGEKGEKGEKNIKIEYETSRHFSSCKINDIWIIGGSSVYQEFIHRDRDLTMSLNVCNRNNKNNGLSSYYITYIDNEYECDTYFPMLKNMNKYHLTQFEKQACIDKNKPDAPLINVYYIVFKKIKYIDDKLLEELFIPCKSNTNKNLLLYVKKTKINIYNKYTNYEHEILFSMFCS
jgi:dihydrofolate reductase